MPSRSIRDPDLIHRFSSRPLSRALAALASLICLMPRTPARAGRCVTIEPVSALGDFISRVICGALVFVSCPVGAVAGALDPLLLKPGGEGRAPTGSGRDDGLKRSAALARSRENQEKTPRQDSQIISQSHRAVSQSRRQMSLEAEHRRQSCRPVRQAGSRLRHQRHRNSHRPHALAVRQGELTLTRPQRPLAVEKCGPDEGALSLGISLAVLAMALLKIAFQRLVLGGELRVGAEAVAERKLVPKTAGARRNEMQVMGAPRRVGLAEPVHLLGQVGRVEVAELSERAEALASALKVVHADQDVDDRLGFQAGNSGATDMVDAALDPLPNRPLQHFSHLLEAGRPAPMPRPAPALPVSWPPPSYAPSSPSPCRCHTSSTP